ncbi:MAG: response regulator [Chloroflexota bacterium]|nr:response regulator [Chloroflexota bacterium]
MTSDALPPKLVLVVEDNEKNLKLVRDILQYRGYRTVEARTAEEGIELARAHVPDLVLMDIRLPGMDGMAALEVLRAEPRTAGIPVVAVTASVMPEERDRFRAAGFDGFIEKPIDVRAFPAQVASFIDSAKASQ